jgi:hypothetical protein
VSFITDLVLQDAILDALKWDSASDQAVPSHIGDIATPSNARAYKEIVRRLTAIGYAQAQIDSWDDGPEFQRDLGLFFAFIDEGLNAGERDKTWLEQKDRRLEIDTLKVLFIGGAPVSRQVPTAEFGSGTISTATDQFVRSPWQQQGRITRW